jgi:cytochrome c biogenesis protein CcmG/thiol:disulfide interchange protein DsbE
MATTSRLAVLLATVAALALAACGGGPRAAGSPGGGAGSGADPSPAPGDPVPDVRVEAFDGSTVSLTDYVGTPLVVNFWASWCPPCVAEMRDAFEPLHDQLGDRVAFLGVDVQDTRAAAREVVERTGVTYELAADPDGELFTAFGGFGMPTTVLVDADGRVVAHHTGALTRAELEGLVRTHLLDG